MSISSIGSSSNLSGITFTPTTPALIASPLTQDPTAAQDSYTPGADSSSSPATATYAPPAGHKHHHGHHGGGGHSLQSVISTLFASPAQGSTSTSTSDSATA